MEIEYPITIAIEVATFHHEDQIFVALNHRVLQRFRHIVLLDFSVSISTHNTIKVSVCKSHYGHSPPLGHIRIQEQDRAAIAGMLSEGVSLEKILDKVRDMSTCLNCILSFGMNSLLR